MVVMAQAVIVQGTMAQQDLFGSNQSSMQASQVYDLAGSTLSYFPSFLNDDEAWRIFDTLNKDLNWQQPSIFIAGKECLIPRKQVWFGDKSYQYTYSGKSFKAVSWHPEILDIKQAIEGTSNCSFNSALCNLYRDGRDSVSWHSDDEPELGRSPIIASYSIGETRSFQLRHKQNRKQKIQIDLPHNSLLIMGPGTQETWEHQVPKTNKKLDPRINLTFREIIS